MLDMNTRESLARLSPALLGDARVRLNLPQTHLDPGIRPVIPFSRMAGSALTAALKPAATPSQADLTPLADLYEAQPPSSGAIIVIQVPTELHRYGIFGEGAATMTRQHGFLGALIEGATRDAEVLRQMNYPVFSRSCTPGYMVTRASVASVGEPVVVGGRTIHNGDVIVGDHDGVIVIRPDELEKVMTKAQAILGWEEKLHAQFAQGISHQQAIKDVGPMP